MRICILGGGALGLATAVSLLRRGARHVTVLERDHAGAGSSALSMGVVGTQYLTRLDIELRIRSFAEFERLQHDHGLPFARIGYLRLAHDPQLVGQFERSVELQCQLGRPGARVLCPRDISKLVPDLLSSDLVAGLFGPDDGYTDGYVLCSIYAELIQAAGGKLYTRHCVTGVDIGPGEVHRIHTSRGTFEADVVVNAGGPWARELGELLGAEVPVVAERHYASVVHTGTALPYVMPMVMDYVPGWGGSGLNFRSERADQLFAEIAYEGPSGGEESASVTGFEEYLAGALLERLPGVTGAAIGRTWFGDYPVTPDGRPLLGPHPSRTGVHCVVGAGGYGIQLAPALGQLAADWILDGPSAGHPLSVQRALASSSTA